MCIGTDENGEPWPATRFAHGIAENFSDDHTRHLYCPVPYVREANPARIIVRMSGFDNTNDGALKLRLCEKPLDVFVEEPASCHDDASTGNGSMGFYTLETDFFPTADTRWVYLHIEIPDSDAQTGRSYVSGYRVCRGSC